MRIGLGLIATAIWLASAPAHAGERLLQPTNEWRLQSASEYCLLSRTFADPNGDPVRMQLQSFGPRHHFKVTLVGEGLPLRDLRRGIATFRYRFKPDAKWREAPGATGYVDDADALTLQADLATDAEAKRTQKPGASHDVQQANRYFLARAAEVDQFSLAYPSRDDTVLQLGSMIAPMREMQDCLDQLLSTWGYDPASITNLRTAPRITNAMELASAIPALMRREGLRRNDSIQFRLDIDESGAPRGCVVQHPRGDDQVEGIICKFLVETARFEPAVDTRGETVRAPSVSSITFGTR